MSIGAKASAIIGRSGYSITYLYDLYTKAKKGDADASQKIALLIRSNRDLDFVFYAFRSAAQRAQDARRMTQKQKKKQAPTDPRNGAWDRLKGRVGKSPGLALQGGLPSLGKGSR